MGLGSFRFVSLMKSPAFVEVVLHFHLPKGDNESQMKTVICCFWREMVR